jgi:chorismate synthase
LTEEDRKAKEIFRIEHAGNQPTEDPENLMSKVFVREAHESYGRRAKNDLVVGYITEKFLSKPGQHAIATNVEEIVKKRNEEQELEQQERLRRRKEKEREMKLTLDMQVQKLAKEKEAVKKQQLELGAKISRDV